MGLESKRSTVFSGVGVGTEVYICSKAKRLAMLQAPIAGAPGKREYDTDARDAGRDRAVVVAERIRHAGGLIIFGC